MQTRSFYAVSVMSAWGGVCGCCSPLPLEDWAPVCLVFLKKLLVCPARALPSPHTPVVLPVLETEENSGQSHPTGKFPRP